MDESFKYFFSIFFCVGSILLLLLTHPQQLSFRFFQWVYKSLWNVELKEKEDYSKKKFLPNQACTSMISAFFVFIACLYNLLFDVESNSIYFELPLSIILAVSFLLLFNTIDFFFHVLPLRNYLIIIHHTLSVCLTCLGVMFYQQRSSLQHSIVIMGLIEISSICFNLIQLTFECIEHVRHIPALWRWMFRLFYVYMIQRFLWSFLGGYILYLIYHLPVLNVFHYMYGVFILSFTLFNISALVYVKRWFYAKLKKTE